MLASGSWLGKILAALDIASCELVAELTQDQETCCIGAVASRHFV